LIPDLTGIRPKSNRSELSELYRVGGWNFVVSISQQILQRFNTLLAAYLFSVSNIVPFSLAGSLAEHSGKITTLAARVLFPTFSHLSQNEQASDTQRLFQIASRISLTVSLIAITVGLVWFEPFMNLWLKNVNQKEDVIASAKPLFLAFGLINVLNSIRSVGWQLILGNDEVEFLGRTMVRESILAIVLSLVLGIGIGVIGLVLGNLIAICISTFWICLPTFSKMINVSNVSNLQAIFLRPIIYSIAIGLGLLSWSRWVTNPENWLELLIFCALPTIAVLMIATPLLLTKTERTIVSSRLFRLLKPT
jgi:O-antigen/teichoic acid export membrane protein